MRSLFKIIRRYVLTAVLITLLILLFNCLILFFWGNWLMKEEQRIAVAYVTTAVELDGTQKKAVEEKLLETSGYAKMEMHYEVDASIIGGMIIRINDRVVDSSVRAKLNGLKKQLLQIQLG